MSVEGVDFGSVALSAAARDLTAPLVLLRQLSFQLDSQLGDVDYPAVNQALEQMRLTIGRTFDVAEQLSDLDFELPRRQSVVAVGNYQALKLMMRSFLTDAMRYSCDAEPVDEGGEVAVDSAGRVVRVRVSAGRSGEASIAIHDNGPGINLAKALVDARRADNVNPAVSRPLMGSLNLLLADRLMRAMHGHLRVHNHRRGGVTVETSLPISQQMSLLGVV